MDGKILSEALLATALLVLLGACGRSTTEQPPLAGDNALLEYVSADTPYLFTMLEPLPDAVLDRLEPGANRVMRSYQDAIRAATRDLATTVSSDEAARRETATGVLDGIVDLFSIDAMRAAGIGRESTMALYAHGLLPVLRVELTDTGAFGQAIADIEADAGQPMPTAKIDDVSYRYIGDETARFVVAIIGNHAVMSIVPSNLGEDTLRGVLGLTLPDQSIEDAGTLAGLSARYGFSAYGAGFIDIERIARTFLEPQSGVNAEVLAILQYDNTSLSDVCRAEMLDMARVAPRVVTGYTGVTAERIDSNTVIELREDLAAGLARLPAPVPGLGTDHGGLLSIGASIDLRAARDFYAGRLDAMEAEPFECEQFGESQMAVAQGRAALERPVPPLVYGLKGFLAVIEDVEGFDLVNQQPPAAITMQFLLATDNAPGLVAMGAMFSPELAMLDLQPDGKPVRFEPPQMPGSVNNAHLAMTDTALALSVGENSETALGNLLAAESSVPPPAFSMHMDASRYYEFVGDATMVPNDGDDHLPADARAAAREAMLALGDLIDRVSVTVNLTSRGIEIPSVVTLVEE